MPAAKTAAERPRLGGLLAVDPTLAARWCWSGSWEFPVGAPAALGAPGPDGSPGFQVNRNLGETGGHQGADLDNRRGGDPVRAAAHGIVVVAERGGWNGGFGARVVLAHRLTDGTIAFSVYAHLAEGSVRLEPGERVCAGDRLGRVGRTGRATTEHLHFEVRLPERPDERWEKARAVDPIAFVAARLAGVRPDSGWSARVLDWAEASALVPRGSPADERLERGRWWVALGRAARHGFDRLPDEPAALRDSLISASVLAEDAPRDPHGWVAWSELAGDLERLRELGTRLPARPLAEPEHRETCGRELGVERPGRAARALARAPGSPTLAGACLALADLAEPASGDGTPSLTPRDADGKVRRTSKAKKGTSRSADAGASRGR